ncbi:hypothetical protein CKO51_25825 [Rhodopirellula sp. SM50]|nr:glycosyltransferase family 4 protein [Rhodopirellula sp. SM50]PAY16598.1 hypothetical protein CKO51_25825 [Rhodopirellula sp. SM50]
MTKQKTIFYVFSNAEVGGGNKVLLRLINRLDRDRYRPYAVIPEAGPFEQELVSSEIPFTRIDCRGHQMTVPQAALNVVRLLAKRVVQGASLLHSNEYPYPLAARGCAGLRKVCHIHHPGFNSGTLKWMLRVPPDSIITPSAFIRDEVVRCLPSDVDASRVEVIWNPIDTEWFRPHHCQSQLRSALGIDPNCRHICILGTVAPHKGHACFLRMAGRVVGEFPSAQFHIVGDHRERDRPYVETLHDTIGELQLTQNVRLWGRVSDQQARDILAASDLFVLPSEEEGFGLVVAEAQACEVPVLTTNMRPLDEVVDDGQTGFLVTQDDDQEYADRALQLLRNDSVRREMGRKGRAWVEDRFSEGQFVDRVSNVYQKLISI